MALIPAEFLFRLSWSCPYVKNLTREKGENLVQLPEQCRIEPFHGMGERAPFAEMRLGWNEMGIGFRAEVRGKERPPIGDESRLQASDGLTLWLDTRDARTSHRGSRYCHQFHFLPTGGGAEKDEPVFAQTTIHRALQDAPLCAASQVPFRCRLTAHGYILEAILSEKVLQGFDPEQHPRLGFYYVVRDMELGDQFLQVGTDLPFAEDPSLWATLVLETEE